MNHIGKILKDYPFVIVDGGLATELEIMGYDLRDRLWSAKILSEQPGAILDVHRSYLEAGADCIITASYQATVDGFIASGFTREESRSLISLSVQLAKQAVAEFTGSDLRTGGPEPFVAASAGCYGAYLANGSEYRGDYSLSINEYKNFHRERIELFAEAGADFIAFETFPNIDEGVAVSELMNEFQDLFYWIVFTAADEKHISHGELFSDCVKEFQDKRNIAGIGINCSAPEFISPLLQQVNSLAKIPLVVYPNSGEHFDTGCTCWTDESSKADFFAMSEEWFNLGARIIGGCCRTGPDDIRRIDHCRRLLIQTKQGG